VPPSFSVRQRTPEDLDDCAALLRQVHERDHYPVRWPADPVDWLSPRDALVSWVATDDGQLLGHVMLAEADAAVAALTTLRPADLLLLRQLFVAPEARGRHVGSTLLAVATDEAVSRGRRPVLEVLSPNVDAIELYQRAGWTSVGTSTPHWAPEGTHAVVFLAPAA
jgi:GNAT superfamily N-acetyltransferase